MAMAMGGGAGSKAEINVTPLVDVLLVLLIIFMVITPMKTVGLEALVPQPAKPQQAVTPDTTIVLQVIPQAGQKPALKINQDSVTWQDLKATLTGIYKTRAEKVMFVKGEDSLPFTDVVEVLDIAHAADSSLRIGLITSKMQAGS
jgi:biopolymer transport protein TolR